MWKEGKFELEGYKFQYKVKLIPRDCRGGIDGSCVVKLWILHDTEDNIKLVFDPIAHYDGGWNIKPRNTIGKRALEYVLNLFK